MSKDDLRQFRDRINKLDILLYAATENIQVPAISESAPDSTSGGHGRDRRGINN